MAGLLLVGHSDALEEYLPHARWQYRRMISDTDYDQRDEGRDCLAIALKRFRDLIAPNNPVTTIPGWLVHPEIPRYPILALRELLVNALAHRDYEAPGSVFFKLYPDRLELSNPGGFPQGITPQNILHHPSVPRYPALMGALTRMRLANESNLGVPRVYRELLQEGKEAPIYDATSNVVRVVIKGQDPRREFLEFVNAYPGLNVDHLLVVQYLTRHREVNARQAASLVQRTPEEAAELLTEMANRWRLLEACGSGSGRYYRFSRSVYPILLNTLSYQVDQRLADEHSKARVLSALKYRPLSNQDVREITQLNRYQAVRLMNSLRREGLVRLTGAGKKSLWVHD